MLSVEFVDINDVIPYDKNSKKHPDYQIQQIAKSIEEFGNCDPLGVWTRPDGALEVVEGHGRLLALKLLGYKDVPVIKLDFLTDEQRRAYSHVHNQLTLNSGLDEDILKQELEELSQFNWSDFGFDFDNDEYQIDVNEAAKQSLADVYGEPPFSVLSARTGRWQMRAEAWKSLGIKSELGRADGLTFSDGAIKNYEGAADMPDTSIFSPVLCEIAYAWFTDKGDSILDPFAGGSVRGIVADRMNRLYTGIDLRQEQIDANEANALEVCGPDHSIKWICGDSSNIDSIIDSDKKFDFIFTCPPYGDLEVYSDNPNDLSNMENDEFDKAYIDIIHKCCEKLEDNRFACFVVGNYRDSKGNLRDLVGLTVKAMEDSGVKYYDDFIYVTPICNVRFRCKAAFNSSRKHGRTHQYMIVFIKGDPKKATERLSNIEFVEIDDDGV